MPLLSKKEMNKLLSSRLDAGDKSVVLAACGILRKDSSVDPLFHAAVIVDTWEEMEFTTKEERLLFKCAKHLVGA